MLGEPMRRRQSGTRSAGSAQFSARLRRFSRKNRRILASVVAATTAFCVLRSVQPQAEPTVPVLVAAADLAAGHTLAAEDLVTKPWPASFASGLVFTDPGEAAGRITAGPLTAGEPIGPSRVVGPGLLDAETNAGGLAQVAAGVRLADPGEAALLAPGDIVDVLAARSNSFDSPSSTTSRSSGPESEAARVIASSAQVIVVPDKQTTSAGSLLSSGGGASKQPGSMVVLAVSPATAAALAGAAARSRLSVVVRGSAG